jgi:hypothetical protein
VVPRRGGSLADTLLNQWSWGLMSSPSVQAVALAAVEDGLQDPEVQRLAAAGSHGRHTPNILRDIMRCMRGTEDFPELCSVRVPAVDSRTPNVPVVTEVAVLLPHEVFSCIAKNKQELFSSFTNGDNLDSFWAQAVARGDPQLHAHPMRLKPEWQSKAVPLLVHGDAGGYTNRDSLEVTSWGALLCKADTWRSRYIASVFVTSAEVKGEGGRCCSGPLQLSSRAVIPWWTTSALPSLPTRRRRVSREPR